MNFPECGSERIICYYGGFELHKLKQVVYECQYCKSRWDKMVVRD